MDFFQGMGMGVGNLQILPGPPIITTSSLPDGEDGSAYSQSLAKTGFAGGTWSITSGSLPTGLSLNAGTGAITGTPSVVNSFAFTVRYTDPYGQYDDQALSIIIASGAAELPAGFTSFLDAADGTVDAAFTDLANDGSAGGVWTSNTMLVKGGGINSNQYVNNTGSTSFCALTGKLGTDLFSAGTGMFGTIIRSVISSCSSDWNDGVIMFGDGVGINKCNTTSTKLRGYRYSGGSNMNVLPMDSDEWACIVHRWGGGQLYTRCVTADSDTGWLQTASTEVMSGAGIASISVFGPRPGGGGSADCDGVLFVSYATQDETTGDALMAYLMSRAGL